MTFKVGDNLLCVIEDIHEGCILEVKNDKMIFLSEINCIFMQTFLLFGTSNMAALKNLYFQNVNVLNFRNKIYWQ